MHNIEIKDLKSIKAQIIELKILREIQEEKISESFKLFKSTLTPSNVIKNGFKDLIESPKISVLLTKFALNTGANLIIDQVLGKNRSVKGFINSVIVENISTGIIAQNAPAILKNIVSFFQRKKENLEQK